MIFYTLQGPGHELQIHEDKIYLIKKPWVSILSKSVPPTSWEITQLSQFEITVPKFLMISGKIQWQTFQGQVGSFRFTTTPAMVKKIEIYLQKRIIKNHQEKTKPLKKAA